MLKLLLIFTQLVHAFPTDKKFEPVDFEPKTCAKAELIIPDIVGNPVEKQKGEYCFDSRYTTLVSKNCQKDCEIKKLAAKFDGKIVYSQKGTPGAWFCLALKGESLGVYLIHGGEKHLFHICKMKDEIISSDYLTMFRKN